MIQLDWPFVSVGRSIAAAMLHFLLPLNSCRLWGEDDADYGEEMMLIVGRGIANEDNHRLWFRVWELPWKHMFGAHECTTHLSKINVLCFELKTKFTAHVKLKTVEMLGAGEAVKPRKRGSRRFWFAAHLHQAETPQTPHYSSPADWIRAVFPSMSSQFHQKYKKR